MKINVKIRMALSEDASAIASVLYDGFVEFESLYTHEAFRATTPDRDGVLERMREGPIWVAMIDDKIIGTASAVGKSNGLYVRGMAVVPTERGMKTGKMLMDYIEDYAKENGFKRLFLSTTPFLDSAIKLYEKCGFQRSSEGPDNLFGTPLFTMYKML